MNKLKKKLPEKTTHIIFGAVIAAVGLFLLVYPGTSLITLCTVLGIVSLISGIIRLAKYLSAKKKNSESPAGLITGIIFLIIAFLLLVHPKFLLSILPFFIGIAILVYGISSLFSGRGKGIFSKILSVVVIIFGGSLMFNPFKGATTITSVIGFGLLVWGVATIIAESISKQRPSKPDNIDDNGYREVDFKDIP